MENRQDVATKLVKIFLGQGLVVSFLDYLNHREVSRTSEWHCLHSLVVLEQGPNSVAQNTAYEEPHFKIKAGS